MPHRRDRHRRPLRRLATSLAAALAAALALAGPAAASSIAVGDRADADPFDLSRIDLTVGMLVGGAPVGPVRGTAVGMHVDAGWTRGSLMLYGEYDLLSIGETALAADEKVIRGLEHRLGGNARLTVMDWNGGRDVPLGGRLWVEGGLGRQLIHWNDGGILRRNDLAIGLGAQLDVLLNKRAPTPQRFALYYALKMTIAEAPGAAERAPTCAGPCDEPSGPQPFDLGVFFNLGLSWAR